MKHRLLIVEGLPCSGKSTLSAFVYECLARRESVSFFDEGTGNHPADYEYHALAPAGLLAPESKVVSLADFSGELLERLSAYKIYDCLSWEEEMPLMLDKWREFVRMAETERVYVFNCVLLQNPMCETMMRFGFPAEVSRQHIERIVQIIRTMNPVIIYLKNEDIADSVSGAAGQRPGWLDAVIDYHTGGAYGRQIGAKGFDGYIRCLKHRQERELEILSHLPVCKLILDNPQRDWETAKKTLRGYLDGLE